MELFKLSKNQSRRIANMMLQDCNPTEKERLIEATLIEPMYIESPFEAWRELSKEEKVEFLKKQEPLVLSVFQYGNVIYRLKLREGLVSFSELMAEAQEDEEKERGGVEW
jgi:hypothetical protein